MRSTSRRSGISGPHRYPFLLIDLITEFRADPLAGGWDRTVTITSRFSRAFPGYPDYAGSAGGGGDGAGGRGITAIPGSKTGTGSWWCLRGLSVPSFAGLVTWKTMPRIEVDVLSFRNAAGRSMAVRRCDGKLACEATLMAQRCRAEPGRKAHGDNLDTNPVIYAARRRRGREYSSQPR